jgi:predicted nuclease with TOPRIM domain
MTDKEIIQEQRAEIQALREDIHNRKARENKLRSKIKSFKTEIERLKEELEIRNQKRASIFEISNAYERGRAEAIKEFADRLNKRMGFCDLPNVIVRSHIDHLVKEMVGEG